MCIMSLKVLLTSRDKVLSRSRQGGGFFSAATMLVLIGVFAVCVLWPPAGRNLSVNGPLKKMCTKKRLNIFEMR